MNMKNFTEKLCNWEEVFSSREFETELCYDGNDLGITYSKEATKFRLWTPVASEVSVNIYKEGTGDCLLETIPMKKDVNGTWVLVLEGDYKNKFTTYSVTFDNLEKVDKEEQTDLNYKYVANGNRYTIETTDIYAKAMGVNGHRAMIVDFEETNPEGWHEDKRPEFGEATDAIIYELHVRDLSVDENSGIKNKGMFIGLAEEGTTSREGLSTGLDHMKELGVTHVHLLPTQDFGSIDETGEGDQFNWGYDPMNYNVPEGSYSTNAYDGNVRIKEFKQMVKALHKNGIRVVMDVVYNHTYDTSKAAFDKLVPNYYYRTYNNKFTNGSGCGNETASDRIMFRKFMVDSIRYWVEEYHVDGFRFDLMAVHDVETMNAIKEEVMKIDPTIILYGEGWIGGDTKHDCQKACFKVNAKAMNDIAVFNDEIRDGIKGCVVRHNGLGFANGGMYKGEVYLGKELITNKLRFSIAGAVEHPQVEGGELAKKVNEHDMNDNIFWAANPTQTVNYDSAHDNWTLWDRILMSNEDEDLETKKYMNKLSVAMVMLSQGIVFLHAGEEMLRSKKSDISPYGYEENSYNKGDDVNMLRWNEKKENLDIFNYYKGLIEFRKNNKAFRMSKAEDVRNALTFTEGLEYGLIAYQVENIFNNNEYKKYYVVFNGLNEAQEIELPDGEWDILIDADNAGNSALGKVTKNDSVNRLSAKVYALR